MTKKLKLYNGRGVRPSTGHTYIAAHSVTDAARMLAEHYPCGTVSTWSREINLYFSSCWGNDMNCITPVRGIWEQELNKTPKKVF